MAGKANYYVIKIETDLKSYILISDLDVATHEEVIQGQTLHYLEPSPLSYKVVLDELDELYLKLPGAPSHHTLQESMNPLL
jgi:hypothetical protein